MSFPHPDGNGRTSHWLATTPRTAYPRVEADERADVVVVGGGIVGITTAYLLAKAGQDVIVVDRERLATAETGHTTAHLQIVIDTRLADLVKRFGLEGAKKGWDSQAEAVRTIEEIARSERIACDLQRIDAYLYHPTAPSGVSEHVHGPETLQEEVDLARQIGYEAEMVSPDEVPFDAEAVVRYPDQGRFHVRKYLLGVARAAERLGVRFFEGTECVDVKSGTQARVKTREGHVLTADHVVQATNVPFTTRGRLDTKLFAYRTYVLGARVPRGTFRDVLYWDTTDPYHYVRFAGEADGDLLLVGGEDHKVGTETDTDVHYTNLESYLRGATADFDVAYRWSGEVIETEDDYPYIGTMPGQPDNEWVATGDSGTGMTNGTIAAVILSERILGRGTPWDELYDPRRVTLDVPSVKEWVKENARVGKDLVSGLLKPSEAKRLATLRPGDGALVRSGIKQFAVARAEDGTFHCVSARCTHMGCSVAWNKEGQSWDCPCHGSRFSPAGELLHGPAKDPLAPADAKEMERLGLRPASPRASFETETGM